MLHLTILHLILPVRYFYTMSRHLKEKGPRMPKFEAPAAGVSATDSMPETGVIFDRGVMKEYKKCAVCRLCMVRRKKWEADVVWAEVKYCSDKCRKRKHEGKASIDDTKGDGK